MADDEEEYNPSAAQNDYSSGYTPNYGGGQEE
jgi:hypothetical protein